MYTRSHDDSIALWFARALLPDGWSERVRIVVSAGRITAVDIGVEPQAHDERQRDRDSRRVQRSQPCLSARARGTHRASRRHGRFLVVARSDVRTRRTLDAGSCRGDRGARPTRKCSRPASLASANFTTVHHAESGAAYADIAELAQRIVAAASGRADIGRRCCRCSTRTAASAHSRRSRRSDAQRLRLDSLPSACSRLRRASRCLTVREHRHRGAQRARGDAAMSCAYSPTSSKTGPMHLAHRGAAARSRGTAAGDRCSPGRMAARSFRCRRALVPRARHASFGHGARSTRGESCNGRLLSDHGSESRRRTLSRACTSLRAGSFRYRNRFERSDRSR